MGGADEFGRHAPMIGDPDSEAMNRSTESMRVRLAIASVISVSVYYHTSKVFLPATKDRLHVVPGGFALSIVLLDFIVVYYQRSLFVN